jgi:hypothetical protein
MKPHGMETAKAMIQTCGFQFLDLLQQEKRERHMSEILLRR